MGKGKKNLNGLKPRLSLRHRKISYKIIKKKIQGLPLTSSLLPDCTLPGVLTPAEG